MIGKLRASLDALVREIVAEAARNPEFGQRLLASLGIEGQSPILPPARRSASNRRTPAILDPIEAAREGEETLRERLGKLNLEQLKDVIADYGMDPGKLVMKWKTPQRIIDRIVECSMARAVKGDVFLRPSSGRREEEAS